MSNEFLRAYTIPLLAQNAAQQPAYVETATEASTVLTAPAVATNLNRYFPPGKQDIGQLSAPTSRPQKRKFDNKNGGNTPEFFVGRDPSYPEELNKLIKQLVCELCNVQMNSPKSAKDHYESKAHDKKLTAWIAHNYPENPPPIKHFVYEALEGEGGPDAQHCKLCDLKLTSLVHAKQHYSGRKHQLVARNISNPSGSGYYNAEGKWIRTGTKHVPELDDDGRFDIGVDFKGSKTDENPESSIKVEESPVEIKKPIQSQAITTPDESLCCKICKISVTSAPQMKTHIEGARHRKNLTRLSTDPDAITVTSTNHVDSLLNSVKNPPSANANDDYSMFRTPSGSYYCQSCNMSMTSVATLQQHIQGKKHMKIIADQKINDAKTVKAKAK